jgi:hypothetical protein
MATQLRLRRGNTTQSNAFTGALAEVVVDTDKNVIVVHDGSTPGGWPAPTLSFVQSAYDAANGAGTGSGSAGVYANAAFIQANSAYEWANSAHIEASGAFQRANVAVHRGNTVFVHANSGFDQANSAYEEANSAHIEASGAFERANIAVQRGNTVFVHANAAYDNANTRVLKSGDTMTGDLLMTANIIPTVSNTYYLGSPDKVWHSLYVGPGSINIDGVILGNTGGSLSIQNSNGQSLDLNQISDAANSAGSYANSAFSTANSKFNSSGGTISGDVSLQGNLTVTGTTFYANVTNLVVEDNIITLNSNVTGSPSLDAGIEINRGNQTNTTLLWSETQKAWQFTNDGTTYSNIASSSAESYANAAFLKANSSYAKANSSGLYANGAFEQANAAFEAANNVGPQIEPAFAQANSASLYANGAFVKANAAYESQNTTGSYANSAYSQANTATNNAAGASLYANGAFLQANAAFEAANNVAPQIEPAFTAANSAGSYANSAFASSNSASLYANAAFIQANAAYNSQNTTGTYANSAYDQANTATNNAAGASLYANGAFVQANAAYISQNTTGTYANSAYSQANTATDNAASASLYANGAFVQSNAAYHAANSSSLYANGAFDYANSAYTRANNSINANTGGTITGDITITGNLIVTGANVALGNVGNVHIYGGNTGQLLTTDNNGNLQWIDLPTPNTITYTANSLIQTNGVYVSGNLWSTQVFGDYLSSNGAYVLTDGSGSAPAWYIDFDFINVVKFNRVVMNINYSQNSGHTIYVQLYNNLNSAWDNIGTYTGLGSYYAFALDVIDETNYLNAGIVQLRLYHSNGGNVSHQTSIDYIALEQSIQGPQGPRGPTGATGATGATGPGVASGGTTGQILVKNSSTNYDTSWSNTINGSLSITENLSVTGNLTVIGTTVSINTSSFTVNDTLLTLGIGNYTSDLLDIGFASHYNDGSNAHTGLFRDASEKQWMFFEGYTPEVSPNNDIIITDPSFKYANVRARDITGNLIANTVTVNGYDLFNYTTNAYNQANTATNDASGASLYANGAFLQANAAYNSQNTTGSYANSAYNQANTATNNASTADSKAVTAGSYANSAFATANNALPKAGGLLTGPVSSSSIIYASGLSANTTVTVNTNSVLESTTITTASVAQVTLDSFSTSTYRSAKYLVQMTSGSAYHLIELSMIHDGTTVYLSQYGEIKTGASLGTFDASISTGTLSVLFTPTNAVTTVKASVTQIPV